MERKCQHPDCKRFLSKFVPYNIIYCGFHQHAWRLLNKDVIDDNLTEEDMLFIFHHLDGCIPSVLSSYLKIPYANIAYYIRHKKIRARKKKNTKRYKTIPQTETIRVISLVRSWVSIQTMVRKCHIYDDTLRRYALEGHFGKTGKTIQGDPAISIYWYENPDEFIARFNGIKSMNLDMKIPLNLDTEHIPLSSVAHYCGIDPRAVYYWYNHDILPSILKNGIRVATRGDFINFLERVARGETRLRPETIERLKELHQQL